MQAFFNALLAVSITANVVMLSSSLTVLKDNIVQLRSRIEILEARCK